MPQLAVGEPATGDTSLNAYLLSREMVVSGLLPPDVIAEYFVLIFPDAEEVTGDGEVKWSQSKSAIYLCKYEVGIQSSQGNPHPTKLKLIQPLVKNSSLTIVFRVPLTPQVVLRLSKI